MLRECLRRKQLLCADICTAGKNGSCDGIYSVSGMQRCLSVRQGSLCGYGLSGTRQAVSCGVLQMTMNQNNLRHRLMMLRFSMWDLHLYLDTHPCDKTAAELLEKYKEKYLCVLKEYECAYGPLSPAGGHGKDWLKGPWPWDNRAGEC